MRSRASRSEIRTQPPVAPEPGGHIPGGTWAPRNTIWREGRSLSARWPRVSPGPTGTPATGPSPDNGAIERSCPDGSVPTGCAGSVCPPRAHAHRLPDPTSATWTQTHRRKRGALGSVSLSDMQTCGVKTSIVKSARGLAHTIRSALSPSVAPTFRYFQRVLQAGSIKLREHRSLEK